MKPKAAESRSIPPPMAIRYPARGTVPAAALPESGGAAVNVRAERDGTGDDTLAGVAKPAADGVPADAEGADADPRVATLSCDGRFSAAEPGTAGWVSAGPDPPWAGPGLAGPAGAVAEAVGAGEGGPPETQKPPAAAGTCLSGQGAALAGAAIPRKKAATTDSTARMQRTSRPLRMSPYATRSGKIRPAARRPDPSAGR